MTGSRVLGLSVLALLAVSACRPREGERCICADDCAGDLVCAADGAELRGNQCVYDVSNDLESGICVKGGNANAGDDALTPPPKLDAGSWATSGQVPVTTAGSESESDATTMPDDSTSSSSGSESTSSSSGESSGGPTTSSSSSGSSDSTGAGSGDTTAAM